jgi:hypothetical protein
MSRDEHRLGARMLNSGLAYKLINTARTIKDNNNVLSIIQTLGNLTTVNDAAVEV